MSRFLLISIKPEYAYKIIEGEKTIELRKIQPKVSDGDYILIYATVPIKAIIGYGKIDRIIKTTPNLMWLNHKNSLGVEKVFFDSYYYDSNKAIGIEISSIFKLKEPITLDVIKIFYPKFSPPQTFRYISFFKALRIFNTIAKLNLKHIHVDNKSQCLYL